MQTSHICDLPHRTPTVAQYGVNTTYSVTPSKVHDSCSRHLTRTLREVALRNGTDSFIVVRYAEYKRGPLRGAPKR